MGCGASVLILRCDFPSSASTGSSRRLTREQNENKKGSSAVREGVMVRTFLEDLVEIASLGAFMFMIACVAQAFGVH